MDARSGLISPEETTTVSPAGSRAFGRANVRTSCVGSIHLVGSRARGQGSTSDGDVVVCVDRDRYDIGGEPVDDYELRFSSDPDIVFGGPDLYFLRPGDRVVRWNGDTPEGSLWRICGGSLTGRRAGGSPSAVCPDGAWSSRSSAP